MKTALFVMGGLILAIVTVFALGIGGLEYKKFFAPRSQAIDRQIFQETPSFVHGKNQQITLFMTEYKLAETDKKRATYKNLIIYEASTIDNELLNENIQAFIQELQGQ